MMSQIHVRCRHAFLIDMGPKHNSDWIIEILHLAALMVCLVSPGRRCLNQLRTNMITIFWTRRQDDSADQSWSGPHQIGHCKIHIVWYRILLCTITVEGARLAEGNTPKDARSETIALELYWSVSICRSKKMRKKGANPEKHRVCRGVNWFRILQYQQKLHTLPGPQLGVGYEQN